MARRHGGKVQRKNSVLIVLAGMLALALLGMWLSNARGAPASPDGPPESPAPRRTQER